MNHPIPDVPVTITILVVSVAVVLWVPVIVYRAMIRHSRSTRESLRLTGAIVAVLVAWFGLSAGYTRVEVFRDGPDRPPWLVYFFFALIVIGPRGWRAGRRWVSCWPTGDARRTAHRADRAVVGVRVFGVGGRRVSFPASSLIQPRSATSQSVSRPASP